MRRSASALPWQVLASSRSLVRASPARRRSRKITALLQFLASGLLAALRYITETTLATVSVGPADLRGLKRLREADGKSFACGVLLHDGDRIQRVGDCAA